MVYVFANWKMYLGLAESVDLAQQIKNMALPEEAQLAVFPSSIATKAVRDEAGDVFAVGAQNVAWVERGAYTGAVSAQMFHELGCEYALIGHSERRHIFGETNDAVRKKLEACLGAGITPVLCIGETAEDRENGKEEYRLEKQLMKALSGLDLSGKKLLIAYEPVWAIGTGDPCDPTKAEERHLWIKEQIKAYTGEQIDVLYGGSVNAENVLQYVSSPAIAGVLVGSASASAEHLGALIDALASA